MKRKIKEISSDNSTPRLDQVCPFKDQEIKVEKAINTICKENKETIITRDGKYKDSWIWDTIENNDKIPGVVKKIKLISAERKGKKDEMGSTSKMPKTDVILTFTCWGEHKDGRQWSKKVSIGFSIKKDNFYTFANWIGFEQSQSIFGLRPGKLKHLQEQTIPLFCEKIKKSGKVSLGYCLMIKSTESTAKKSKEDKMLKDIFKGEHSFKPKEEIKVIDRLFFDSLQKNDNCQALYKKSKCSEDLLNLDTFLNSKNIHSRKSVLEKANEKYNKLYFEVRPIYIENDLPSVDLLMEWKPHIKIKLPNLIEIKNYDDLKRYGNWEPTTTKVNTPSLLTKYENKGFCFTEQSFINSKGKRRRAVKNIGNPCIKLYKQKPTYTVPKNKIVSKSLYENLKRTDNTKRFYFQDKNKIILDIIHDRIDTNYAFKLLYDNYIEESNNGQKPVSFVKPREKFVEYIKKEISKPDAVCEDMFNNISDVIIQEGLIEYSKIQKGDNIGKNNKNRYVLTRKGRIWGEDLHRKRGNEIKNTVKKKRIKTTQNPQKSRKIPKFTNDRDRLESWRREWQRRNNNKLLL